MNTQQELIYLNKRKYSLEEYSYLSEKEKRKKQLDRKRKESEQGEEWEHEYDNEETTEKKGTQRHKQRYET